MVRKCDVAKPGLHHKKSASADIGMRMGGYDCPSQLDDELLFGHLRQFLFQLVHFQLKLLSLARLGA
jgi:hypothetical protein